MTLYKRIGIDTSKAVFTLHGIDHADRPTLRIDLRRGQLVTFFRKLAPTEIVIEACGGSHHWARELGGLGHTVRLIPPQYVKPYLKRGKNDRNDAAATCEAGGRPDMRFVPGKPIDRQAGGMLLKVRQTLLDQRTRLVNSLRGHAAEFGMIAARGVSRVEPLLAAIAAEDRIPDPAKEMFAVLGQEIAHLDERLKELNAKVAAAHKANEVSRRLAGIPGVGPITALTLANEIDPQAFHSARHLAAWIGLTPREHSTGGKQRMGGISRAGHERLRALLVAGATAVITATVRHGDEKVSEWLRAMLRRKPRKLVAVALANKMARIAWALMTHGETYRAAGGRAVAA
jgi:transposase